MNQEVMNIFNPAQEGPAFVYRWPARKRSIAGHLAKFASLKRLITGHLSRKKTGCFVPVSLARPKIMNAFAVNISA